MTMDTLNLAPGPPDDSNPVTQEIADEVADEEDKLSNTHESRLSFVMIVAEKSLSSLKGTSRTQISILKQGRHQDDLYSLLTCLTSPG